MNVEYKQPKAARVMGPVYQEIIQKDGDAAPSERTWLRDETGGSVYLRLSTRPIEQIQRKMTPELQQEIVDGAYWHRRPGPNCQVVVAYTGAIAPEAIEAVSPELVEPRQFALESGGHFGRAGPDPDVHAAAVAERREAGVHLGGGATRP